MVRVPSTFFAIAVLLPLAAAQDPPKADDRDDRLPPN
jgi:hypothetical protein